ncbi:MAG: GIN domain-containing protein [Spirochaetia bacterium]
MGNARNLEVSGPFDVILVSGSGVKAHMNDQVFELISVTQQQNLTVVSPRQGMILRDTGTTELLVGIDSLDSLTINTTASISTQTPISKRSLNLTLGGTVVGGLALNMDNLTLNLETPKLIVLTGKLTNLTLNARTSMAHIDLRALNLSHAPTIAKPVHGTRIRL